MKLPLIPFRFLDLTPRGTIFLVGWVAVAACERTPPPHASETNLNTPLLVGSDTIPAHEARAYLASAVGFTSRGGQVFCSYTILGQEGNRVFVWAACEELVLAADSIESGSGSGAPAALVVDTLAAPARIVEHQVPGDGSHYARDIRRIFPSHVQREIQRPTEEHNRRMEALRAANRQSAAESLERRSEAGTPSAASPHPIGDGSAD